MLVPGNVFTSLFKEATAGWKTIDYAAFDAAEL